MRHRTKAGWDELGVAASPQIGKTLANRGGIRGVLADPGEAANDLLMQTTSYNAKWNKFEDPSGAIENATKSVIRTVAWSVGKRIGVHIPGVGTLLKEASRIRIGGRALIRLKGGR